MTPDLKYPVVYALDGQWDFVMAGDIYGKLIYDEVIPHYIIVGITWSGENVDYASARQRDFTPSVNPQVPFSGGAQNFLNAMELELFPFVEQIYRANSHRTLIGSSLGGLFTTYALLTRPDLFDGYIALSAPYILEKHLFEQKVAALSGTKALCGKRVYVGVGDADPNRDGVIEFARRLKKAHLRGLGLKKRVSPKIGHAGIGPVGFTYGLLYVFEPPKMKNRLSLFVQ